MAQYPGKGNLTILFYFHFGIPLKKDTHCSGFQKQSNWGRVKASLLTRLEMSLLYILYYLEWEAFPHESLPN